MVSGNQVGFRHLRAAFQGQKYTPITIWAALRFQRDQINSLRNGRDSDLKQIENAFKDPEDGFWEKNSSEHDGQKWVFFLPLGSQKHADYFK